jgi:hypothetical protein
MSMDKKSNTKQQPPCLKEQNINKINRTYYVFAHVGHSFYLNKVKEFKYFKHILV